MYKYGLPASVAATKRHYPGWGKLLEKMTEKRLTAKDLNRILGLTYRQLNDWESRGMLPSDSERAKGGKGEGWRKFSVADLIPLGILREMKNQGIPITRLKQMTETLFLSNQIFYYFFPNVVLGVDTFFYTNFETYSGYDSLDTKDQFLKISIYSLKDQGIVVFVPLDRIIDRIFANLELEDFKGFRHENGTYSFIVNEVPIALEKLLAFEDDPLSKPEEFFKQKRKEKTDEA